MLKNYTQDLLFSMERLSFNPYAVRRLMPGQDTLAFTVDDAIVKGVTGADNLQALLDSGSLFYADHRNQATLTHTANYAAACDAYFFISGASGQFLPLAIRTNFGSNLIYTPHDEANDWLLAKMMYNVNDFFHGQFHHLANTHFVTEVAYQAAIRTLSDDHPALAILKRLMYGAFGIRPLAVAVLFRPGGSVDQFFGFTGSSAASFSAMLYSNGVAGDVQNNYFVKNLEKRGLLNSPVGPQLKNFPFYEDAKVIYDAIHDFMTSFVNSYYTSDGAVASDPELQAWLVEANGPAGAINFPTAATMKTRLQLIDLLTHMAHLVSSSHHAVNTNQLITGAGSLPFNPSALYQPIPTKKGGITNLAPFLPPASQCVQMILNQANFARPLLAGSSRTIVHMFDDAATLGRLNKPTKDANDKFMAAMRAQSTVVKARTFGADGLSQGMPFVWQALDPDVAPWSLTI
ncbi:Lipoxygenase-4 [Orbilia brochopaga]|nr:Lipoxygenase-4 [Drechslerella brochopaga]